MKVEFKDVMDPVLRFEIYNNLTEEEKERLSVGVYSDEVRKRIDEVKAMKLFKQEKK